MLLRGVKRTTKPRQWVPVDQANPLAKGLVGAFLFNAHSGLTVRDSAGTGDGTATAVSFPQSFEGPSGSFDGTSSFVNFTAGGVPNWTPSMPISGLFRFACTSAGNLTLACQFNFNVTGGWVLRINGGTAGTFDFFVGNAGGSSGRQKRTNATFNDGKMHTGIFTYDGSNTVAGIHLYVDSPSEQATTTEIDNAPTPSPTAGALAIGKLYGAAPQFWAGTIDAGLIWNRVLQPSEVSELLRNPYVVFAPARKPIEFYTGSLGPVTHSTSGALAGQGSSLSGSARHIAIHATSGALTGQGSSLSGAARRFRAHAASGALAGSGSTLAGAASLTPVAGAVDQLVRWRRQLRR